MKIDVTMNSINSSRSTRKLQFLQPYRVKLLNETRFLRKFSFLQWTIHANEAIRRSLSTFKTLLYRSSTMYVWKSTHQIDRRFRKRIVFVCCSMYYMFFIFISPRWSQHIVNNDPYTYCSTCTFLMQIACVTMHYPCA